MKYKIITAESSLGVHINGSNKGPMAILKQRKNKENEAIRTVIEPYIKEMPGTKENLEQVNKFNAMLYNNIINNVDNKTLSLVLGGDHSISIGSALASKKINGNLGIIWLDSHGDYNTFKTTITKNIHGLPFAAITGYENEELTLFHDGKTYDRKNAVLVGARDLDELELDNIKKSGITVFTTEDIKKYGTKNIMNKAIEIAKHNTDGIHISYDIDLIDPLIATGVSIKASNGINEQEAYDLAHIIKDNINIVKSIDVVEYNPDNDIDFKTLEIVNKIIDIIIK